MHLNPSFSAKLRFSLILFILGLCLSVQAQTKKEILKKAEAYFDSSNFQAALPLYLKLHKLDTNNGIYNYAIGVCYSNSPKEKLKSIPFFERAARDKKSPIFKYVGLNLGLAYAQAYRFTDAISVLEKYLKKVPKVSGEHKDVTEKIEYFKKAQELVANPVKYPITNLGPAINGPFPEYSPVISADESVLIFTTRRPTGVSGTLTDETGQYYEDIFISVKNADGSWTLPTGVSDSINTMYHDASVGLSADGQQLFVYKDDAGDGNIYLSTLNGGSWSTPKSLGANINSEAFEPSACLSADGNTLYFVSDRKGGLGGTDIYKSKKLPTGEWAMPVNLGPTINTELDEDSPFIQSDEKGIYFSSKGRTGLGGFDIFHSLLGEDGQWGLAKNIGYPINTTDDDLFYVLSANGSHAYYASDKEGGQGEKDLYMVSLPTVLNVAMIKGRIVIDESDTAIVKSSLEVFNNATGELVGIYKPNSKTGMYLVILNQDASYGFNVQVDGFEAYSKNVSIPPADTYTEFGQEFHFNHKKGKQEVVFYDRLLPREKPVSGKDSVIAKTTVREPVVAQEPVAKNSECIRTVEDLLFEVNKKALAPKSKLTLDQVYKTLKENPSCRISVEGHTDNTGGAVYNHKLSRLRANTCKQYLVKKGIDPKRILSKGFGESKPDYSNDTAEGRKKNRRVKLVAIQ